MRRVWGWAAITLGAAAVGTACGGGAGRASKPIAAVTASAPPRPPGDPCAGAPSAADAIEAQRARGDDLAAMDAARALFVRCPGQLARWQVAETLAALWVYDQAAAAYAEYGDKGTADEKQRVSQALIRLEAEVPPIRRWRDLKDAERASERNEVALGQTAFDAADYSAAADHYEKAYKIGTDPQSLAFVGRAHEKMNQPQPAATWYARALAVAESTSNERATPKISTGYADQVKSLAFSLDGKYLAAGSSDHWVRVWDLIRGREYFSKAVHDDEVRSVAFSPDGTLLASGSRDGRAKLFDFASGREVLSFEWYAPLDAVAIDPGGTFLATAGVDGTIRLWDLKTGAKLRVLVGRATEIFSIAFAPDARVCACGPKAASAACKQAQVSRQGLPSKYVIAAGTTAGTVEIWEIDRTDSGLGDARLATTVPVDRWGVRSVAFSPDGTLLATAGSEGSTKVFQACDGTYRSSIQVNSHKYWANSVAFNADGSLIADASNNGIPKPGAPEEFVVEVANSGTGHPVSTITGHTDIVEAVAFNPTTLDSLASAGDDGNVRIFNADLGTETNSVADDSRIPFDMSVSADGGTIVECGRDRTVTRWSLAAGARTAIATGGGDVLACKLGARERLVASVSGKLVSLTDLTSGAAVASFTAPCALVETTALSPDDQLVVVGCSDGTLAAWSTSPGAAPVFTLDPKAPGAHTASVNAIVFAPDGKTFFTASGDKTIRAWDAATFKPASAPFLGHEKEVYALAMSPDGSRLASGGSDHKVLVFNVRSPGDQPAALNGHTDLVRSVAFTADGRQVVSTGSDETVRVWDVGTAKQAGALPRFSSPGSKLAFRADGKLLYAMTRDGQIRIFATTPGYPLVATLFGAGTNWVVAGATGEVDATPGGQQFLYWQVGDVQFRNYVAWGRNARPGLLGRLLAAPR